MEVLGNGFLSTSNICNSSSSKDVVVPLKFFSPHQSSSSTALFLNGRSWSSSSLARLPRFRTRSGGWIRRRCGSGKIESVAVATAAVVVVAAASSAVADSVNTTAETTATAAAGGLQQVLLRPTAAEAARTVMEVCVEGTLSTLSQDGWPLGTEVRFAVDVEGNPVLRLQPSALHTKNLLSDSRCSLHAQLEQPGRQKPQCTLRGRIVRVDESKLKEMEFAWERRFGKEHVHDHDALYMMKVEQVLQAQDMGEEEIWVMGTDYSAAVADPLRECAPRIVEDMNRKHWEDIRRFCNVYTCLDAELEEASMTWVDRLGFDMRVLTCEPHKILEIRIPFPREVTDERDARSALTIMAQIAWEKERNYNPAEALLASV
jgi:putative heme iron utilization protein